MKRRSFLTTTTLASAGLSTFLISGFSDIEKKEESKLAQNSIDIYVYIIINNYFIETNYSLVKKIK